MDTSLPRRMYQVHVRGFTKSLSFDSVALPHFVSVGVASLLVVR